MFWVEVSVWIGLLFTINAKIEWVYWNYSILQKKIKLKCKIMTKLKEEYWNHATDTLKYRNFDNLNWRCLNNPFCGIIQVQGRNRIFENLTRGKVQRSWAIIIRTINHLKIALRKRR